ncbi:DNA repair protein RecN [Leekyejoonella antrihumi]|uniref:DNA repair protein RecN n=1 Tax=Leekyejoonella antrihumi TaxID=1660198 RepID=A0A563DXN9_9MICO|nr:DNA repair protein RecN [Leekyejoonella antrihumi]TWP34889.1 DNA repair protein RecN [Leekyejoonella antrihumi]
MLREIRIRGLGVIDDALLELSDGLNVVTGETGAGKTMVVQGLGLLLGGRADPALVRSGSNRALVEGIVDLPSGHPALMRAGEAGADEEEAARDGLVLARSIAERGRSRAHIGGRSAPVGVLAELGEHLVAVHGQADQWRLQRPEQHRVVLDDFGGRPLQAAACAYRDVHDEWSACRTELDELTQQSRERAQRLDLLTAGLTEIERVDPRPGEDETTATEVDRLAHADGLREGAAVAHRALVGDEEAPDESVSVAELIARSRQGMAGLTGHDPTLEALDLRLKEIGILAADVAGDLSSYLADLEVDPARLATLQDRRAELAGVMRKYGASIDDVLGWAKDAAAQVDVLAGSDDRIAELTQRVSTLDVALKEASGHLTEAREKAAGKLARAVTKELAHLALGSARIEVNVRPTPGRYGPHGCDEVEIVFAASKGATARTIAKGASGGELSRVMLALEVVTAGGQMPTFVFDEVDAGVGGAAALDVGARLQALAKHAQVIVVTHLAQVAAYGDRHLVVRKHSDGHIGLSDVAVVDGDDRRNELARMLGGVSDSAAARSHAEELMQLAR